MSKVPARPQVHQGARVGEDRGDRARIGITAFAQEQLGDVVFVELPKVGRQVSQHEDLRGGRVGEGGVRSLRAAHRRGGGGQRRAPEEARGGEQRPLRGGLDDRDQDVVARGGGRPARAPPSTSSSSRAAGTDRGRGDDALHLEHARPAEGDARAASAPPASRLFSPTCPPRRGCRGRSPCPRRWPRATSSGTSAASPRQNANADDFACFLGAGSYDHAIPSPINHLISRGEFFTAYTPYQPEASQGTLRTIFEYQTMMAELTGMDVANASIYDGASSLAEAVLMAHSVTGRAETAWSRGVNPLYQQVVETYCEGPDLRLKMVRLGDGVTDLDALAQGGDGANGGGGGPVPELLRLPGGPPRGGGDRPRQGRAARGGGGPGQPRLPHPARRPRRRHRGGRGAGSRRAHELRRAQSRRLRRARRSSSGACRGVWWAPRWTRTASAGSCSRCRPASSTSGARRPRRTSAPTSPSARSWPPSTCPSSASTASAKSASSPTAKAHYAAERFTAVPGVSLRFPAPFFKEFALTLPKAPDRVIKRLLKDRILAGVPLRSFDRAEKSTLLVAVTETPHQGRDRRLRRGAGRRGGVRPAMEARAPYDKLIFELSAPGRFAYSLPALDVPSADPAALVPAQYVRATPPELPEVSEVDVIRHYSRLSPHELRRGHALLPARLLHHEVQPQDQRGHGAAARLPPPAPARAGGGEPGGAPAHVGAGAGPRRDLRDGPRLPPARGGRPGRVRRRADDPRVSPRARRAAAQGAHPRLRPRHQSRHHRARRLLGGAAQVRRGRRGGPRRPRAATSTRTWPRS